MVDTIPTISAAATTYCSLASSLATVCERLTLIMFSLLNDLCYRVANLLSWVFDGCAMFIP